MAYMMGHPSKNDKLMVNFVGREFSGKKYLFIKNLEGKIIDFREFSGCFCYITVVFWVT